METGTEALCKPGERIDDLQLSGLRILQDPERFCFGLDAVLLSGFVRCPRGARLLDLGTGTGILPLLLSAKTEAAEIVGLEIQEESADMARRSVALNGLRERVSILTGDLREAGAYFAPASFTVISCNPPYIADARGMKSSSEPKRIARHEVCCTLEDVVCAAGMLLKPGGRFCLVYPPERLPELICRLREHGLEPKRLRVVHPYVDRPPSMVLLEAARGGRQGLTMEPPLIVYDAPGEYTAELRRDFGY